MNQDETAAVRVAPLHGGAPFADELIVKYLLVRNDLASLNPGKGFAQSDHAGTQMILKDMPGWSPEHQAWVHRWAEDGDGFGTVLAMGVSERTMLRALDIAARLGVPHATIRDKSYPLQDGETLHLIPLITCAYIFGPKVLIENATKHLDLHA